ncbi:TetR/AcrR family transcriptional regulator [Nocardioides ultimimeridianus]
MKEKRTYTMRARATSVEDTRTRIQEAVFSLVTIRPLAGISLDDIAGEAGVSVQTVLRHFGSRAGLVEATMEYAASRVAREREAPVGDVPAAMRVLLDHYELRGDTALLMLSQEQDDPLMRRMTDNGRALHRRWVAQVFAPYVGPSDDPQRLIDLLVVATDVYAWKLLRHDRGLSRSRTQERMTALVDAVLAGEHRH